MKISNRIWINVIGIFSIILFGCIGWDGGMGGFAIGMLGGFMLWSIMKLVQEK